MVAAAAPATEPGWRCGPGPGVRRGRPGQWAMAARRPPPASCPRLAASMAAAAAKGCRDCCRAVGLPTLPARPPGAALLVRRFRARRAAGGLQLLPWLYGEPGAAEPSACLRRPPTPGEPAERGEAVPSGALECRLWWPTAFWPWTWSPTGCG